MSALSYHISHYSPYIRSVLSTAICQNIEIKDLGENGLCFKFFTGFKHTFKHIIRAKIFNAFFALVFNTEDGLRSTQSPGLESHGCVNS